MVKLLCSILIVIGLWGCSAISLPTKTAQEPTQTLATVTTEPIVTPPPTLTIMDTLPLQADVITKTSPTTVPSLEVREASTPPSSLITNTSQAVSPTLYPVITLDNITQLAEVYQWHGSESYPDFAWSSDGQVLVINIGSQFLFYDVETFTQTSAMTIKPYPVRSFAIQPMLSHTQTIRLAIGGNDIDNTLQLWDASTTQPIITFVGHDTPVRTMTFSLDGQQLVAASPWPTPTTKIWDTNTGELIEQLDHGMAVEGLDIAYSPDGQLLAELVIFGRGSKAIYVWEVDGTRLLHHEIGVKGLRFAFSSDSERIYSLPPFGIGTSVARTGEFLSIFNSKYEQTAVTAHPDGQILATGTPNHMIQLWNSETGELLHTLIDDDSESFTIWSLEFNPAGTLLASHHIDSIRVWGVVP